MKRLIFLLAASLLLLIPVSGQVPVGTPEKPVEDKPVLPVIKEEVTVTATRSEIESAKSPIATGVVTLQENRIRNVQTIDQGLTVTDGVYVLRTKGPADNRTRVTMRGFNGDERTLVLIDGQPINDGYSSGVSWTTLPTEEIDRVEVARGPFSSLYGGNAMGGVINILTRPIDRQNIEFAGQYGTYNSTNYSGRYSNLFFGKLGVSLGYQRLQSGGYNTRPIAVGTSTGTGTFVTGVTRTTSPNGDPLFLIGRAGDNWYNQHAYRGRFEYRFTPKTQVTLQYIRQNYGYGYDAYTSTLRDAAGNVVVRGPVTFVENGVTRRLNFTESTLLQASGENLSHFVNGSVVHTFSPNLFVRFAGGMYSQPEGGSRTPSSGSTLSGGPGTTSLQDSRSYYGNAQVNWQVFRKHDLVMGAETRADRSLNENYNLSNYADENTRLAKTFESIGKTFYQAFYVQDTFRPRENVTIIGGVRYDYWKPYDSLNDGFSAFLPRTQFPENTTNSVTGKLAGAWQPGDGFTLRASVGTAFRNPNVLELYRSFRLASGTLFLANPQLQPERLFSWELGVRKNISSWLNLEGTFFRNSITNLIYRKTDFAADPAGRTRILVNAGEGDTKGVELSARMQLASWLQFRTSYTFTEAVISSNPAAPETEGRFVPNIPQHFAFGSLLASYKRFYGSLDGRYVTKSFSVDTNLDTATGVPGAYDPYFLMGVSGGFRVTRFMDAFASVENLLDRQYFLFYLNPGRTVNGGVRFRF